MKPANSHETATTLEPKKKKENRGKKKKGYFATVPAQEILPIVDGQFESNVKGMYVVGDVTGLPLVKVAANQGRTVIEKMEAAGVLKGATSAEAQSSDDQTPLDLVIIGGGPAGISAAIECEKRNVRYVLLERSQLANTVRTFPAGKKVYAEPQSIKNISELDVDRDLDRDDFLKIVEEEVRNRRLKFKEGTEVSTIARPDQTGKPHFEISTKDGNMFPARLVLVAIGRQGQPRKLEISGCDDCAKVTYRLHTREDYDNEDVLVVGGGNSAIEAALMLKGHNRVTLSYRGEDFYRAKPENRKLLDQAIAEGSITAILKSNLVESRSKEVDLKVGNETMTIANDKVIVLIGQMPPVDFMMDAGLELDGVWTAKRVMWSILGLAAGIFIYFFAGDYTLHPDSANGKMLLSDAFASFLPANSGIVAGLTQVLAPIVLGLLVAVWALKFLMANAKKATHFSIPWGKTIFTAALVLTLFGCTAGSTFTGIEEEAGGGPYFVNIGAAPVIDALSFDGTSDTFTGRGAKYFSTLSGIYYLLYFSSIAVFGIYWAVKSNSRIIWRRNLTIIACQWTLWWGIPTFLVVLFGRNAWSPVLLKSINAWPLNMGAFNVSPAPQVGDPQWWTFVGVVGVVWAAFLTFILIPLFTIQYGKIYCSYICSCGALAETVGNGFRHRGPKGDWPRRLEKYGFVFILLATVATVADLMGVTAYLSWYNFWVGTFLAGAVAIGFYPFLGQRIWCRMWCPLAFWMNFWGRWSKFKITPEKGKCIDCNVCNQYCQMGIDIKSRALKGEPVTLADTPCVGCAECVVRCPMDILHLGDVPEQKLVTLGTTLGGKA